MPEPSDLQSLIQLAVRHQIKEVSTGIVDELQQRGYVRPDNLRAVRELCEARLADFFGIELTESAE